MVSVIQLRRCVSVQAYPGGLRRSRGDGLRGHAGGSGVSVRYGRGREARASAAALRCVAPRAAAVLERWLTSAGRRSCRRSRRRRCSQRRAAREIVNCGGNTIEGAGGRRGFKYTAGARAFCVAPPHGIAGVSAGA